jgi:endonuclease/exonuclease/phosphatase family metal-dependent hydrolase
MDLPVPVFRSLADRVALVVRVKNICFANVHLDHGQVANRRQLRHLVAARVKIDVIAGDFNALGRTRLPGFEDVGPRSPTHFAKGVVPVRIDRCLTRNMAATRAEALGRGKSDHRPILIDLELMEMRGNPSPPGTDAAISQLSAGGPADGDAK